MSRRRRFTDEECQRLAEWARSRSTYAAKAKELGVSEPTLRDAIARGNGEMTEGTRRKLSDAELTDLGRQILERTG